MERKSLHEILSKEQARELEAFVKKNKGKDPVSLTNELREIVGKWKDDLKDKGLLSDYFAYAFAYLWSQNGDDRTLMALKKARTRKNLDEVV